MEVNMRLIGMYGEIGSGKSSASEIFREKDYMIVAIADRIKRIASRLFNINENSLWGRSKKRNVPVCSNCRILRMSIFISSPPK